MAEETVRLPESPNINRSWRRVSTGKLSFLYSEDKILPNYLRSPTGSCHDACKYGRKHESEDKPRVSPLKRVNRSFSGTLNLDSPLRKRALTKSVLNSSFGSGKCDSVGGSDHGKSQVINFSSRVCDVKKNDADRTNEKAMCFSESRLADLTKRKKKKNKTVYVPRGRASSRSKEMVEHNRRVTALKLKSVAQTAAIALRRSTVNQKKMNGGSKAAEPKKTVMPLRASMSSKRCSRCLKRKKESNSLRVPQMKTRKHVDEKCKDLVEEKTLYVIKMETGDEIVESDQNQRCVMDSPTDDRKSEKSQDEAECVVTETDDESSQEEEEEEDENVSFSEDKNTTRQGKSKALSAETDVNGKSMKLRIKRGKIIDFGSQDNSPRKLKFKRGKIASGADTTSKSAGRRRLKTKGTNFRNDKEQQHRPRVVLKHQDTQKKKESRVLFNNVIEETANKLVQTRKSKVKALVGAFESVISLQEGTSSATT